MWGVFLEMHDGRRVGGMGGSFPLAPADFLAYQELAGVPFTAFEVDVLRAFDRGFLDQQAHASADAGDRARMEREWDEDGEGDEGDD